MRFPQPRLVVIAARESETHVACEWSMSTKLLLTACTLLDSAIFVRGRAYADPLIFLFVQLFVPRRDPMSGVAPLAVLTDSLGVPVLNLDVGGVVWHGPPFPQLVL